MHQIARRQRPLGFLVALLSAVCVVLSGCVTAPTTQDLRLHMPLQQGWFEGQSVFYITTDASDAEVAKKLGANFSPRLVHALPPLAADQNGKRIPSSVDKVYAFPNFAQANVFASAPKPMGYQSTETAYTPIWLMVTVTWKPGHTPRALKSEDAVLDAEEKGFVVVTSTGVIVNCPIVHRGALGALPGASMSP